MRLTALLACLCLFSTAIGSTRQIRLPRQPRISPDGQTVAFTWQEDVWTAPAAGGTATRLTLHAASDSSPVFSPDGTQIAFVSSRSGGSQIHVMAASGGEARQVTVDSNSKRLLGFTADGKKLLVAKGSDRGWHYSSSSRLFLIDLEGDAAPRMLFDAGFTEAALSPDGSKVLFTRGSSTWSRKGYLGAMASQLWLADLSTTPPELKRLDQDRPHFQNVSVIFPLFAPDGDSYYFVSDPDGTFDIYFSRLDGTGQRRVTRVGATDHSDDGVAFVSLSADGNTMLFRRRFDLHRLDLKSGATLQLELTASGDAVTSELERREESSAGSVAFTDDGKQMAFVSGEDLYVMDRILKEPVRITDTPHQESSPVFSADGKRLFFVSDVDGETDIYEATHEQEENIWWLAKEFKLRRVTEDAAMESSLKAGPGGEHVAYVKGTDLFLMDQDGSDHRKVIESWSAPEFDWSPDGKWLIYTTEDADYNPDVWVMPIDGTQDPHNLSQHPDSDGDPVWSGDGKRVAWVSRRDGEESDIYYVNLTNEEEEKTERDKKLEDALAAMKKDASKKGGGGKPSGASAGSDRPPRGSGRRGGRGGRQPDPDPAPAAEPNDEPKDEAAEEDKKEEEKKKEDEPVKVVIDFDGLEDRMHRISVQDSTESGLIWSPDGKKLAFSATVDGERGFFSVEFPKVEKPKKLGSSGLSSARWLKKPDEIVGLSRSAAPSRGSTPSRRGGFGRGGGTPAAMSSRGEVTSFSFEVRRIRDWGAVRQISFDQGWRAMRDRFYDETMNNRNWEALRQKYRPVARQCLGAAEFSDLMNMMLGELNASHMGHRGGSDPLPNLSEESRWSATTFHLGLRFEAPGEGKGLVVESVIPGSPCHRERSRVKPGEILLAIDGRAVGPDVDVERLLTMDDERDLELLVADGEGNERQVTVRPTRSVRGLLYDEWVEQTRLAVEKQSAGRLGYLHIRGMDMTSFRQMEEDLYHAGNGKDGLIIDVRWNGGGSTTDHVLTALTQPRHAITKSRGSGEGYPQDRKIYASWDKPIVLMCNQHSFSNAEILSHAVKQIGRGRLVGMRTAGGVISTGSVRLLDGSSVRMPMRGWYLASTGKDMELNGCEPDIVLWNSPVGEDLQLKTAVEALLEDVAKETAAGQVKIEPAAERRLRQASQGKSKGEL